MSNTYRAAVCTALTGPQSIEIQNREVVALEPGQVRVSVKAAGLNFPDLLMTYGKYQFRPDPPFVPGLEVAGIVSECAADVTGISPGDRVMTGSKGGGFAEQIIVPQASLTMLPEALSFAEGSCWYTAAITAWHALHDKADLQSGETILILGASGGVGMACISLAKHMGARIIGTGSHTAKREAILAAGADHALDPADPDLAKQVKSLTNGVGAAVVMDPVGGELAIKATRSIAWGGRYLIVGFASGDIPSFPANHALIKGYSLMGLRAGESGRRDPALAARNKQAMKSLAAQAIMRPNISHLVSLEQTAQALKILEKREAIGRVVLEI